jgi:1-acyl-sn-glycerol-3-phosphate acyltransferase
MPDSPQRPTDGQTAASAEALLDVIEGLLRELHPQRTRARAATLDSPLEGELGLDSLGRVELLHRLERAFGMRLPDRLLVTAETPRDLLRALRHAGADGRQPLGQPVDSLELAGATTSNQATTLVELVQGHAQAHPDRLYVYLYDDDGAAAEITYADLFESAAAVAGGLRERGLERGQTVAIMLPTGRDFFSAFYGVLLAGGIPVPIYPPQRLSQIEEHVRRQASILRSALAAILITVPEARRLGRLLSSLVEGLQRVVTVAELRADRRAYVAPSIGPEDIALLQYTSGSTGTPKGVILTHANLLANIRAMGQAAGTTSREVFVSWLPLYHDMGLIGACLGSLYYAWPLVLMSPLGFLARPERWLWAIHRHRGTISAAPNFAYDLCARRLADGDLEGLDLSSWRLALNGAEPVSADTVERFAARFARYGFRPSAMTPVYGLAEATLGLTFPPPGRGPRLDRVKRQSLQRSGYAEPAPADDPTALRIVGCGRPIPGHQVRIVDALGYEVAERRVGRLQFRGPSATSGYFRDAAATRQLFDGEWLDSGDLAYVADGEVYLTGRAKDLIIRAGRNIYPHELEAAIGEVPGIRKGCVVVFGSPDPVAGTERLVVVAETRATEATALEQLRRQVEAVVMDVLGAPADEVVLAPPHTVLKTSSGKVRRADCRERYARGELGRRRRAVWWQLARLGLAAALPQLRRLLRAAADVAYAGYAWTLVGLFAGGIWLAAACLPPLRWRRAAARGLARWLLRLAGIPVTVRGRQHLPPRRPCVLAVNHASYVDALVLLAVLPTWVSFVAKRELTARFFPRVLFTRLGTEFVERFDPQRGIEDTARVLKAVQAGRAVLFFPEGTFTRAPGLLPFRMGAFVVAAQAGVPLVPLAIAGTRSILRAGQWLPRRGAVTVSIGAPLLPPGSDWAAAVALRDAARAQILRLTGEPDLAREGDVGSAMPEDAAPPSPAEG